MEIKINETNTSRHGNNIFLPPRVYCRETYVHTLLMKFE